MLPFVMSAAAGGTSLAEPARFTRADSEIVLDGRLDEPSWSLAPAVTRFFEVYPANVGTPTARTEAQLLYDERSVYVGIRAHDPAAAAIRSSLARRDQPLLDQDYVEILLDPLNTRRSALLFRTNPDGVQVDGQYDESARARYYTPDFDFDVRTSRDATGWTAEFRIPLATLRYRAGSSDSWAFAIYRNWPRDTTITMASIPVPRSATCLLCFAGEASGISLIAGRDPWSMTPHVTFARRDGDAGASDRVRAGVDAKWQPRADTAVDVTISPDFSQVEADSPQLIANTRFALSLQEKRPFFLEGLDLFAMPIPAVYTRTFTEPDAGIRVTRRGGAHEYSALVLRDAGGGLVIEPGPIASSVALQDFESTAFVGRYEAHGGGASWGALTSGRLNDDNSRNFVVGLDADWAPTTSDRVSAQFLRSETVNPNRPDLLAVWTGQKLAGTAASAEWVHLADAWYGTLSAKSFSTGFRAWNGFVAQVGVSSMSASTGLYFYPYDSVLTRISPVVSLAQTETTGGARLSRRVAPGINIQAARDTQLALTWSPKEENITPVGLRSFDSLSASISSTPVPWLPNASLSFSTGEALDLITGEVDSGRTVRVTLPLRLQRLDLSASMAYQSLDSRFTERNLRANAIWHFSNRLYVQGIHQTSTLTLADARTTSDLTSLLFSYQSNWQTRYFVGFRQTNGFAREREVFAKLSYAFSR